MNEISVEEHENNSVSWKGDDDYFIGFPWDDSDKTTYTTEKL